MDAKRVSKNSNLAKGSCGQSLLEFLIILPVFIGIFVLMLKVNAASQISIVNQKYTRLTLLRFTFNDPWLVNIGRATIKSSVIRTKNHRFVMGIAAEPVQNADTPLATTQLISRNSQTTLGKNKDSDSGSEPKERAYVRIRNTITICTPWFFDSRGTSLVANLPGQRALNENDSFDICSGDAEMTGAS